MFNTTNCMCYMSLLKINMFALNYMFNYSKNVMYECDNQKHNIIISNVSAKNKYDKKVLLCFKHTCSNMSKARQYPCSRQRLRPSEPGCCPAEIVYLPISKNKVRQCPCSRQRLRPSEPGYCPTVQKQMDQVEKYPIKSIMLKIRLYKFARHSAVACLVAYNVSKTKL